MASIAAAGASRHQCQRTSCAHLCNASYIRQNSPAKSDKYDLDTKTILECYNLQLECRHKLRFQSMWLQLLKYNKNTSVVPATDDGKRKNWCSHYLTITNIKYSCTTIKKTACLTHQVKCVFQILLCFCWAGKIISPSPKTKGSERFFNTQSTTQEEVSWSFSEESSLFLKALSQYPSGRLCSPGWW